MSEQFYMENLPRKDRLDEEVDGTVVEALPNMMFRVDIGPGQSVGTSKIVLTYLAGKMRMNRIKVLIGDKVKVKLDIYGEKGRVIRRY